MAMAVSRRRDEDRGEFLSEDDPEGEICSCDADSRTVRFSLFRCRLRGSAVQLKKGRALDKQLPR
jgi:hypothetical protein